ncbi:bleomycin resistance protein [Legionella anisa]|uniref:bleomycin resistance protein n=1 Tax=Legionella anisa TaxID=28082 RepID=UPI0010411914|nr:VOC family protein [Legionella anisa]
MTTPLTPELCCTNIKISLSFYIETLGFNIQYQRKEDGFAILERQGARIMLEEIRGTNRIWIAGTLEAPFGRGMNLEVRTDKIDELYDCVQKTGAPIFLPIEEKRYRVNDTLLVNRQFIVLDPDGYMLRFSQNITEIKTSI